MMDERGAQRIALVRAPTNVQGSRGGKSAFVGQMDGAKRALSVRLAENIGLPRDSWTDWSTVLKTRYEFESG